MLTELDLLLVRQSDAAAAHLGQFRAKESHAGKRVAADVVAGVLGGTTGQDTHWKRVIAAACIIPPIREETRG